MRFKIGDKVMAKWPGSALYFHAKITKIDEDNGTADVLYEDGTDMEVSLQHLASEKIFTRRSKSPARRRSRSRSPGRSPARQTRQSRLASGKQAGKEKASTASSSSSEETKVAKVMSSPFTSTTYRSSTYEKKEREKVDGIDKVTTRTLRSQVVTQEVKNNMPARVETSDGVVKKASRNVNQVERKYEFGGPFGILFMYVTLPLLPIVLMTCCEKTSCELLKFKLDHIPRTLSSYYDKTSALILVAYMLFHAGIYALPLGYVREGPMTPSGKKTKYRISAFYTLLFSMLVYGALQYYNYPVVNLYKKFFPMVAMIIPSCYVLNLLLHVKSFGVEESELNQYANTGCTIYDMFFGHELHPKFGEFFQIKLFIYRPAMIAWILIDLIYLQKEFETNGSIRPSVAILVSAQIFYCIFSFFIDELYAVYSFDMKYEGAGFMALFGNFVIVPFIYTMNIRYLIEHPTAVSANPLLFTVVATIVLGLALIHFSNTQKLRFRQNPYEPSLTALESIPPSKKGGDRLLVSGYWGFVRHPNYLGEIMMGLGFGLACGFKDISPWIYLMFVTFLLAHRALRDEARCQEKHGYAWKEYCKRVPYRLIPFVF